MTWGTTYFQPTQMTGVRKVSVKNGSKCAAVWAPWTNDFSESWMVTDKTIWSKQTINLLPKTSNQKEQHYGHKSIFFHLHRFRFSVCIARNRSSEPGTLTSQRCCPSRRWKTRRWKFGQCGTRGLDQDGKFVMDRTWMVSPIQSSSNIRNDVVVI